MIIKYNMYLCNYMNYIKQREVRKGEGHIGGGSRHESEYPLKSFPKVKWKIKNKRDFKVYFSL